MGRKERRVRVVLTDGKRAADYIWLRHPADGRAHYTVRRGSSNMRKFIPENPVPLHSFKGHRRMFSAGLATTSLLDFQLHPFERQEQDAIAFLDLRAFPEDAFVWTELGLVEVGKTDQLQFDFDLQQLLLVTSVRPWVYVAVGVREGIIRFGSSNTEYADSRRPKGK